MAGHTTSTGRLREKSGLCARRAISIAKPENLPPLISLSAPRYKKPTRVFSLVFLFAARRIFARKREDAPRIGRAGLSPHAVRQMQGARQSAGPGKKARQCVTHSVWARAVQRTAVLGRGRCGMSHRMDGWVVLLSPRLLMGICLPNSGTFCAT